MRVASTRTPDELQGVAHSFGAQVHPASVEQAASGSDVVLVAIPYGHYTSLPGKALHGKVVVDAMNYYPARDGEMHLGGSPSSLALARHLPSARVVKAFNTMYFRTLASGGRPKAPREQRLALFVAGDDAEAKRTVMQLIDEIGFAAIDTGELDDSYRQEPGSPIYNRPLSATEATSILNSSANELANDHRA